MKVKFRFVGVLLAGAAFASAASAAPEPAATQIQRLEVAVNAAYAANNLPTYFTYYSDDLRAMFPEGPTTLPGYKKSWTAFIKGGGAILGFKYSDMKIQVAPGGDAAVASYEAKVSTRTPGKGVSVDAYSETDVWYKRAGQWKIVEVHYSENPTPAK